MDGTTVLGRTIEIDGEIEGAEDLVIQGTVRGRILSQKDVTVDATGSVEAVVSTCNLSVNGRLQGNVDATGRVEIGDSGRMIGDVKAPRVVLADGSKFRGKIDTAQDDQD
jgi:cytoskeletal protein CcmA (bactofilin family)